MICIWKKLGYLNNTTLETIQERAQKAQVSAHVGKLSGKIDKFSFNGFTKDELKNFFLLFSVNCLHDILPRQHMECLTLIRLGFLRVVFSSGGSQFDLPLISREELIQYQYNFMQLLNNLHKVV